MIIKPEHKIYKSDLTQLTGKQRSRLNGSDFDALINGGWGILLYIIPVYDKATHKLGVLIEIPDNECTHTLIAKTQAELDADLQRKREGMIVDPLQFRKQLNSTGKRQDVEDYIATLPDQDDKDRWFHTPRFERLNPMVVELGIALGFSETAMDNFFISAAAR
jgi:hypothetical protein